MTSLYIIGACLTLAAVLIGTYSFAATARLMWRMRLRLDAAVCAVIAGLGLAVALTIVLALAHA
jgi:hypothetical protein